MKRFIRIALIVLFASLIGIQFFHPARNNSGEHQHDISSAVTVPDSVRHILETSCFDCHSNTTNYPWYTAIQPVHWWLDDHIQEGKHDLNFNEFASYKAFRQYRKLQQIDTMVQKGEMPLPSYTIIHRDAILSAVQKEVIHQWAVQSCDSLKRKYPADSLRRPVKRD